ncbi:methionyl-tRNA formyltransferase [Alcanivorax marinus]|uniref:Methionyl-tRNA formyltransferase n=1 Tax=Alloalcanivorax marinus TaxID=1177169 RepID=A0A9Q3YL92_9GAMM|nr:methionyl-tRNA formyltransferase [Alloalcanivorax marinus]MCC4307562.1 methionyl-tRNA formyltransferase [Alloalcanivorax marinus]MCU5785039.1 methionyl-tRNA formyltransferase [Alloalcanivorax marinus]
MSTSPLRLAFAGTPDFAAVSLRALIDGPHEIAAVLTQPDRGAGRGKKVVQSPVKQLALAHDLPVLQPESLKGEEIQRRIADLNLDALIVVAYGLIIPRAVLDLPRLACVNVHGSLLPRWRGAAPIQWAIMAGDTETGNTIMKMDAGLDTGPMLLGEALTIGDRETGGELHDRLAAQGARLLSTVLDDLPGHLARAEPQPEDGVTYAHKLSKPGARIDFGLPARGIVNRVRAFNPWPVAWVELNDQPLRIWGAEEAPEAGDDEAEPGRILTVSDEGLLVACGDGAVRLTRLQLPGKKPLTVAEIRRGHPDLFQPGAFLG